MTAPSRGGRLYAGTLVTIAAAAGVRFFTTSAAALPAVPPTAQAAAAVTESPTPTPTDQGTSLSWGRGPHATPTPTLSPSATPSAVPTSVPTQRPAPTATHGPTPTAAPKPAAPPPAAPAPAAPPPAPTTKVVVGSTVQTPYGPVQVSVTFTGGVIEAVQALQAPSGGYSSQVSSFALPTLSSEAVAADSANIAAVSGASFTSAGYKQSLQYAIDHKG